MFELEVILWLCAAFALSFVINLVPAFMPSTWMILACFYIRFDLPLLPLTIGGALASALGRLMLARGSTWFKHRFLHGRESGLHELGGFLNEHRNVLAGTVFLYALTPLPTNNLFIAAGMVEVNMVQVLLGFAASRILANTFWVWTTNSAFEHIGELFKGAVGSWAAIVLELMGVVSVALLYFLPWEKWFTAYVRRRTGSVTVTAPHAASAANPAGDEDPPPS